MRIDTIKRKKMALCFGDIIIILISTYLSIKIRLLFYGDFIDIELLTDRYLNIMPLTTLIYVVSFYIFDLYNVNDKFKSTSFLARNIVVVILSSMFIAILYYMFLPWGFGRGIYIINIMLLLVFTYLWRLLFQLSFKLTTIPETIGIIGAGYSGNTIYDVLNDHEEFNVKAIFDDDPQLKGKKMGKQFISGNSDVMMEMVTQGKLDSLVVAITHKKSEKLIKYLVECKMKGIQVYNMPTLYEDLTGKIPIIHLEDGWFVYTAFQGLERSNYKLRFKRMLDFLLSVIGLVLFMPLMVITAILIRISSKGPVLFRQHRVGLNSRGYEIVKFRSMRDDAESEGAVWATENDPRITPIGKIIRLLRIDELPQMWNVLKGEMSFIGPRPERPEFVKELSEEIPFYSIRHVVKPGITGWAQVNYRYGASKKDALEKLQYDVFYIKNMSPILDIHIILRTIKVVLFRFGAR